MSSLNPLSMTFTEDDLRSVPSRNSPQTNRTPTPVAVITPQRASTPLKDGTPPRVATPPTISTISTISRIRPPKNQSLNPLRPSTAERRRQVNEILAEEEREYRRRRQEKQQQEDEDYLKSQLKLLEEERQRQKRLSKPPQPFQNEYKRFSNSRYYNWDSDEDLQNHNHKARRFYDVLHEDGDDCELCRRGLEQERRERERRLARLRARSRSEHCRTIQHFVDDFYEKQ